MKAKKLIDLICPEHSRTTCSDEDISNGFTFELDEWNDRSKELNSKYLPRCKRCALLEIASSEIVLTERNKEIILMYF